jgi:hypothetical protein
MLPICAEAVKRIQSVSIGQNVGNSNHGGKPTIHSLLIMTASRDFHRRLSNSTNNDWPPSYADVRQSPFITADPVHQSAGTVGNWGSEYICQFRSTVSPGG